jgi:hypothetical protein
MNGSGESRQTLRHLGGIAEGCDPAFRHPAIYPAKMAGYRYPDNYPDILSGWPNMGRGSRHHRDMVSRLPKGWVAKSEIPTQIPTNCRDSTSETPGAL